MFAVNAAGIRCKLKSFNQIMESLKPQIWMVEETKLKPNEIIKCEASNNFNIYYLSRQDSQGGGLALGVQKDIESTLVTEGNDETEVLSVQVVVGKIPVRIVLGYGPQENAPIDKKNRFWEAIEKEVSQAEIEGHGVLLQMDGNLHAGSALVKGDPNPQNRNGKLFMEFLERNKSLTVVNTLNLCQGIITRRRELETRTEEAVLDFCIVNDKLRPFINKMIIDEARDFCLSNVDQVKKNERIIETDHNGLIVEFDILMEKQKLVREEMINLKNKICQEIFKEETENNIQLLECFQNELPVSVQCNNWKRVFNSILHKCFKKVRITNNKKKEDTKIKQMLIERVQLKKKTKSKVVDESMKLKIEERIIQIEEEIGREVSEEYQKEILETLKLLGGDDYSLNGTGRKKDVEFVKEELSQNFACSPCW